jgi:hypothetical protein
MQDGPGARIAVRCELIGKERNALRTSDLGRVNVGRDRYDRLAFCNQFLGLFRRGDSRIGQPPLNVQIVVQMGQVLWRRDSDGDEGTPFRGLS